MNQSNDFLKPQLVAADRCFLSLIEARIQNLSESAEHLSTALSAIKTNDDVSKGVIVAIKSALLANGELASLLSGMMNGVIHSPTVEVTSHE